MNVAFSVGDSLIDENGKYVEELSKFEPKSGRVPSILELVDTYDYDNMVSAIRSSSLPAKEKTFLILTSSRKFLQFNYSNIAKYYEHASEEMQALMRESALIILDKDTADSLGFVKGVIRER